MSIKSQTPGIASDMPLNEKQREPNYEIREKGIAPKLAKGRVNNISDYVKKNLSKTVKPRHGESR
jgi:hypothetical protein